MSFALHPQLAADTVTLADWALSRVCLMDDARYPWLILVPRRAGAREIEDLEESDRVVLMEEIATAGHVLREATECDRLNVAALGNVVAQLHVHVIARFATDAAWPGPVWGVHPALAYEPGEMESLAKQVRKGLE